MSNGYGGHIRKAAGSNVPYPSYKHLVNDATFKNNGSLIVPVNDMRRKVFQAMQESGYEIPMEHIDDFIVLCFEDVVGRNVEYNMSKFASTEFLEKNFGVELRDRDNWVTDFAESLVGDVVRSKRFGVWEIFFRNDDFYFLYKGDYTHMLYYMLQAEGKLPETYEVLYAYHCGRTKSISECAEKAGFGDIDDSSLIDPTLKEGLREHGEGVV